MRRKQMKKQKQVIIICSLCLLLCLCVGYAAFNTTLSIRAKGNVKKDPMTVEEFLSDVTLADNGEDGLYFHDGTGSYINASEEVGDDSYRYSGANPNNYVCFGTNTKPCPSNNMYRIIGIFDNKIKLIKNTAYSSNYWSGSSTSSSNVWANSTLNTEILNNTFYNSLGEYKNMLALSTWSVGGINNGQRGTAKTVYDYEIGSSSLQVQYEAYVGLLYISDYGYAANPSAWSTPITAYTSENIRNNNWLFSGGLEWTISRQSDSSSHAYFIDGTGLVFGDEILVYNIPIRPTFYLNDNIKVKPAKGSIDDPYYILE